MGFKQYVVYTVVWGKVETGLHIQGSSHRIVPLQSSCFDIDDWLASHN